MKDSKPTLRLVKEVNETTTGKETVYYTESLDKTLNRYDLVPGSLSFNEDLAKQYFNDLLKDVNKKTVEILETSKY
ncbi:MAG: hypothetical protein Unbinned2299contig1000_48 [Prokaryotic dsDNA virus sp.]|nr:MAG: hypothetical protein Unbinned2299contig1000_48 [Prokaryotic dsDNA virus sp.]|tara:strand:+ start:1477 stop:1704 length:228 start_codon:yes stop_codon:yes gene_type:complete